MTRNQVAEKVRELILNTNAVSEDDLQDETRNLAVLLDDSMAFIELEVDVENEFDITVSDDWKDDGQSLGRLIDYVFAETAR